MDEFDLSEEIFVIFNDHPVHQTLKNRFGLQDRIEAKIKEFTERLLDGLDRDFKNGDIEMCQYHRRREEIIKLAGDKLILGVNLVQDAKEGEND